MTQVVVFSLNWVKIKKEVFTAIRQYIRPELVGFVRDNRHFRLIVQRSILHGGILNLDGGDAKSRWGDADFRWGDAYRASPHNLSTGLGVPPPEDSLKQPNNN